MKKLFIVQIDGDDLLFVTDTLDKLDAKIQSFYKAEHDMEVTVECKTVQTMTYGELNIWEVTHDNGYSETVVVEMLPFM